MKQVKYIIGVCIVLSVCAIYACTKGFVDKAPQGSITSLGDSATAVQATNGVYGILRTWPIHVFAWLGITEMASDEADKGSTPTDASFFLDLKNYTVTPSSQGAASVLDPYWGGQYQGINRANLADWSYFGVPGLSTGIWYAKGWDIDGTHYDAGAGKYANYAEVLQQDGEKHHEIGLVTTYKVQQGTLKDSRFRLLLTDHRASQNQVDGNVKELRLVSTLPFNLL